MYRWLLSWLDLGQVTIYNDSQNVALTSLISAGYFCPLPFSSTFSNLTKHNLLHYSLMAIICEFLSANYWLMWRSHCLFGPEMNLVIHGILYICHWIHKPKIHSLFCFFSMSVAQFTATSHRKKHWFNWSLSSLKFMNFVNFSFPSSQGLISSSPAYGPSVFLSLGKQDYIFDSHLHHQM